MTEAIQKPAASPAKVGKLASKAEIRRIMDEVAGKVVTPPAATPAEVKAEVPETAPGEQAASEHTEQVKTGEGEQAGDKTAVSEGPKGAPVAPVVTDKPKEDVDPRLTKSWENVLAKDGDVRKREQAIKAQSKEYEELRALKQRIEDDLVGYAYEKLGPEGVKRINSRIINGGKPSAEDEADTQRKRADRLEAQNRAAGQTAAESRAAEANQHYKAEVARLVKEGVKDNPDAFEFCRLAGPGQIDEAFNISLQHFNDTCSAPGASDGEIYTPMQALEILEKYEEEQHAKRSAAKKAQRQKAAGAEAGGEDTNGKDKQPEPSAAKTAGAGKGSRAPEKKPEEMTNAEYRKKILREAGIPVS